MSCYVALVLTQERILEILSLLSTQQHVSTVRFVILIQLILVKCAQC